MKRNVKMKGEQGKLKNCPRGDRTKYGKYDKEPDSSDAPISGV